MIIRAITITNFRSFKGTQRLEFPEGPGLFFLWGENRDEPRLDANGSGKTSVWEALYWCLFGTTSSGLKAGDVSNWDVGKRTQVEVEYETEDPFLPYCVTRVWSPNSWTLRSGLGDTWDLAKDETNPLQQHLGLGAKPFLSCVLMAQGQRMFLDLEATEKAALFAEVMDLDRWLKYAQRASDLSREADHEARQWESKVARLEGSIEQLERQDTQADLKRWEQDREDRLRALEQRYLRCTRDLTTAEQALKAAGESLAKAKNIYAELLRKAEECERSCSKCGQPIHDAAARAELKHALAEVDDFERRQRQITRDIAAMEHTLDQMEHEEERILGERNPYAEADSRRAAALLEAAADLASARAQLDRCAESCTLYSYWVKWFKGIRLALIAESLRQLELEVNSCVNALGLVGWELLFHVDKETKSGSVSRGFTVTVRSPHNDRLVPWKAWSGGESQRLRIATNMGLSNLIRSRTGCGVNLEVWDEATQWLSGQGVQDLLDALKARAQQERRQIWVVDHRTLGYAAFTGAVGVVKTATGSEFVTEGSA